VIASFEDRETEKIWNGFYSKKFPPEIQRKARKKLLHIDSAVSLNDLKIPPGNRLHLLSDDRKGQYSISINDQWRICFNWKGKNAENVVIIDYH